jgi:hypothetical protein
MAAPNCSSCNASVVPYCGQCCPRNFTEQHYEDHPSDWPKHPPMFLAQQSTEDTHADLCATRCDSFIRCLCSRCSRPALHPRCSLLTICSACPSPRCRNYHDTLLANNVPSKLVLVPAEDERCFCLGTPGNAAAAGSPVSHVCGKVNSTGGSVDGGWTKCAGFMGESCCIQHTMGFASMVEPLVEWCLGLVAGRSTTSSSSSSSSSSAEQRPR